jgi:hypothetical protein
MRPPVYNGGAVPGVDRPAPRQGYERG